MRQKIGELTAQVQQVTCKVYSPTPSTAYRQAGAGGDCVPGSGLAPAAAAPPRRAGALSISAGRWRRSFSAFLVYFLFFGLRRSGRRREDGGARGQARSGGGRGQREWPGARGSGGGAPLRPRHPRPAVPSRWVRVGAHCWRREARATLSFHGLLGLPNFYQPRSSTVCEA